MSRSSSYVTTHPLAVRARCILLPVAIASDRDSIAPGTPYEITPTTSTYLLEARTGRTARLTTDPAVDQSPLISRGGKTLL